MIPTIDEILKKHHVIPDKGVAPERLIAAILEYTTLHDRAVAEVAWIESAKQLLADLDESYYCWVTDDENKWENGVLWPGLGYIEPTVWRHLPIK